MDCFLLFYDINTEFGIDQNDLHFAAIIIPIPENHKSMLFVFELE